MNIPGKLVPRSGWPPLAAPLGALVVLAALVTGVAHEEYVTARAAHEAEQALRRVTAESDALPAGAATDRGARDVAALRGSQLFGVPVAPQADAAAQPESPLAVAAGQVPEELPVATAGVTVQGIVYSPLEGESRTLLSGVSETVRSYRVGDELPGRLVIRFIESGRVVVEQDGELKALPLSQPGRTAALGGAATGDRRAAQRARLRDVAARNAGARD